MCVCVGVRMGLEGKRVCLVRVGRERVSLEWERGDKKRKGREIVCGVIVGQERLRVGQESV